MSNISIALINTRLQPGGGDVLASEPFQRHANAGETVETVLPTVTGLKPGVNEMALFIYARLNNTPKSGEIISAFQLFSLCV
jgi:hypothetical protein